MTPAEELAAAAFQLRNPHHLPGLKVGIDTDLAGLLADLLEHHAKSCKAAEIAANRVFVDEAAERERFIVRQTNPHALAIARLINQPRPAVSRCMCGYPDDKDVHHPTDGADCRSIGTPGQP